MRVVIYIYKHWLYFEEKNMPKNMPLFFLKTETEMYFFFFLRSSLSSTSKNKEGKNGGWKKEEGKEGRIKAQKNKI